MAASATASSSMKILTIGPPRGQVNNVIQKIWNGWVCGTTVTSSSLADKQIMMVAEEELAEFVASQ